MSRYLDKENVKESTGHLVRDERELDFSNKEYLVSEETNKS
jgi:hypothetical protein